MSLATIPQSGEILNRVRAFNCQNAAEIALLAALSTVTFRPPHWKNAPGLYKSLIEWEVEVPEELAPIATLTKFTQDAAYPDSKVSAPTDEELLVLQELTQRVIAWAESLGFDNRACAA